MPVDVDVLKIMDHLRAVDVHDDVDDDGDEEDDEYLL